MGLEVGTWCLFTVTEQCLLLPYCAGKEPKRPRIVVLGTGWGAHAFLSSIDALKYEVVVVSPRNFMLFTPMLAASAVGTVEYRSITEVDTHTDR